MTYDEMLTAINSRLNYERKGMPSAADLRIDRVATLLAALGNPHLRYPVVHIAGTKGKGSTAMMTARLATAFGLKTGLHVSPHLDVIEERFQIDGQLADGDHLAEIFGEIAPVIDDVDRRLASEQPPLTFFEITTALVLLYFARQCVDLAVVEVGMGGRLDSTNVVDPAVSVITSISRDHTRQLGDTLAMIAGEKAGIIKRRRPVVAGPLPEPALEVVVSTCARQEAPLRRFGLDFNMDWRSCGLAGSRPQIRTWNRRWPRLDICAPGRHQAQNAAIAAAAIEILAEQGHATIPTAIGQPLADLAIPGRVEIMAEDPLVIIDVAHNDASIEALLQTLRDAESHGRLGRPRVLIFAASREKDWPVLLDVLAASFDEIVVTNYWSNPRFVPVGEIVQYAESRGLSVTAAAGPAEAWKVATDWVGTPEPRAPHAPRGVGSEPAAAKGGMICVTGSFYLAAEIRQLLREPAGVAT